MNNLISGPFGFAAHPRRVRTPSRGRESKSLAPPWVRPSVGLGWECVHMSSELSSDVGTPGLRLL